MAVISEWPKDYETYSVKQHNMTLDLREDKDFDGDDFVFEGHVRMRIPNKDISIEAYKQMLRNMNYMFESAIEKKFRDFTGWED